MASFQQLPSGRWRVQVRRAGLYRAATFTTKREAKDWAAGIESQVAHIAAGGFAPPPKGATLADLIERYEETTHRAVGRSRASTMSILKRDLGRVKLVAVSAVVLRDFIDRRAEAGAGGSTIASDLSALSAVLKWGRHARHLDLPVELAMQARASLPHRGLTLKARERDREPTDDELQRLYAYWRANSRRLIDMIVVVRFALATGMRLAEICGLQVDDIEREHRTALIRDRKDPKNKIGNNQRVPLLPEAWALLEPILAQREPGSAVFGYHPPSVSQGFTRACQALGIEDLHFHDLRHRATAQFFRMGLDIPRVALLTGHKTWAMLRRYTDIKPADVHDAVERHAAKGNV